jgi:hypothetical protein
MRQRRDSGPKPDGVDALIDEVIVDARGDAEQLQAFQQVLDDRLDLPTDAYVIGEPVLLLAIDFDGNTRRGLTARCVREDDGSEHTVAACDVRVPEGASAAPLLAAYRRWLNPTDNQGARFLLGDLEAGRDWEDARG